MGYLKKLFFLSGMLLPALSSFSQLSRPVEQLKEYCKQTTATGYSSRLGLLTLVPGRNLHYLFPFYHAFHDEAKFIKVYSEKGYYDELSQYFAFAEDYQTALQYLVKSYDSVDDATRRKVFKMAEKVENIEHVDARLYINFAAKIRKVVMINEAYDKPLHRAFVLSLLPGLYRQGYRYLAMEMLDNFSNHSLSKLNLHTGYYTSEPVAGELVRSALALGFTLVSYEDTAASKHTVNRRDSIQAENIYEVLRKDTAARILVYAAGAHISKKAGADGYIPMGLAFRRISGIDPLTIDQTDMTEESNFGYGRVIYQAYLQKYPLTVASIARIDSIPVNAFNNDLYDLSVIHPPTTYKEGRPTWLSLGATRQPTFIKPTAPNVFLVQAYYEREVVENDNTPWQLVPADQTYIPGGKKNYLLYLKKGKYRVYFRDINYQILGTLNVEVN
jgi:hypothetical protein